MATDTKHLSMSLERIAVGRYVAVNARGGRIECGTADGEHFTPTELLLVALAGCTAIDVDFVTSRRAEPDSFEISVDADKVSDSEGNHLTGIQITYRLSFPATEGGDKARAVLPGTVRQSEERLCTVGRTVQLATPIRTSIE
jgi:putative redox protein